MPGNEEVLESLKIEINVGIRGQNKLDGFIDRLTRLSEALDRVNDRLREYASNTQNIGSIRAPRISTPQANVGGGDITTPSVAEEIPSTIQESNTQLSTFISRAREAAKAFMNIGKSTMTTDKLIKRFTENAKSSFSKIGNVIKRVFTTALSRTIRAMLRNIVSGIREGIQNLAKYSESFNKTMSDLSTHTAYLKNAMGTLAQPLLELVVPAITKIINLVVELINKINEARAILTGAATYTAAKKYTVDYAKNLEKASKSAKEIKNSLLGFDEINRLNDNSSASSGAGGTSASDMFEERAVDTSEEVVNRVRTTLRTIERIAGALLLAVGCVLLVFGNIPLGIACIIAGVALIAASLKYGEAEKRVETTLAKITAIVGAAALAVGAILAFTDNPRRYSISGKRCFGLVSNL